jgi:hypothetical protein
MKLRFVAIPVIAAICAGSPAMAHPTDDEQQVRGKGARDRGASRGGTSSGGASRGGDSASRGGDSGDNQGTNRAAGRTADRRGDGGERTTTARGNDDRGSERQRVAVPREPNQNGGYRTSGRRNHGPVVVTRTRPNTNIYIGSSYRGPRYYAPLHYDRWARQYYNWSPIGYVPWGLIAGSVGWANFSAYSAYGAYGAYSAPYAYAPAPYAPYAHWIGAEIGAVRLKIRPREAQVFVDGNYAGLVDDFDGTFQSLRMEQGGHKIEIHMPGFEDLEMDVHVQPGRTITLSETLRPRP